MKYHNFTPLYKSVLVVIHQKVYILTTTKIILVGTRSELCEEPSATECRLIADFPAQRCRKTGSLALRSIQVSKHHRMVPEIKHLLEIWRRSN